MSIDIPTYIETDIEQYAQSEHISTHEAVVKLIYAGLNAEAREENRIQALLGEPMSEEDAALIDEVVDTAMKARGERWESRLRA